MWWTWLIVFAVGGTISSGYWYLVKTGLAELALEHNKIGGSSTSSGGTAVPPISSQSPTAAIPTTPTVRTETPTTTATAPPVIQHERPILKGTIDQITGLQQQDGSGRKFLVKMTLTNEGEESIAMGFALRVIKDGKEILRTPPSLITNLPLPGTVLGKSDNLPIKANTPLKKGRVCGGFLLYVPANSGIPDEQAAHFQDAGIVWKIEFEDYRGNRYSASHHFVAGEVRKHDPFVIPPE